MIAQASTTAGMARPVPSSRTSPSASARAEPLASISLPKTAPSRKSGKNEMMKLPVAVMKTWV